MSTKCLSILSVLCTFLILVTADKEWFPGDRPPSHIIREEAVQIPLQPSTYLMKKDVPDTVKPYANTDFTFAVGPQNPIFYGDDFDSQVEFQDDTPVTNDDFDAAPMPVIQESILHKQASYASFTFLAIVAACVTAGVFGILVLATISYKIQKKSKAAADVEYPAYGVTGPHKDESATSDDNRLAQSAQMYHYQHQKQQIIALERSDNGRRGSLSEPDSDEDNEEGDYTVYECSGLASTGEMEVKNPLFLDIVTPASPIKKATDSEKPENQN